MAHKQSKIIAYDNFVVKRKTQKESARLAKITTKTMGDWVKLHKWKERRDALMSSKENGLENLMLILNLKTEKLLELERDPKSDPTERFNLTNEIAGIRKTKNEFEKANIVPFETYVTVADGLMSGIIKMFPKQKIELLDFFEEHISEVAQKY
jgi:hypothetical protein